MKEIKKIFMIMIVALSTLMMVSCTTSHKLPTPMGEKVQLSALEFQSKFELLELGIDAYNMLKTQVVYNYTRDEAGHSTKVNGDFTSYTDDDNKHIWADSNFQINIKQGIYKGIAKGFENEHTTYFDIKLENNNKFDAIHDPYKNYNNGTYKMNKSTSSWGFDRNRLSYIYDDLGIDNMIFHEFAYAINDFEFIKQLYQLGFDGLSFYSGDTTFSIQLDIKNHHLGTVSQEIKETIINHFHLSTVHIEYFEYYILLNFESDKLVEMGLEYRLKTEEFIDGALYTLDGFTSIVQSIVDNGPDTVNYDAYTMIESLDEIIKQ